MKLDNNHWFYFLTCGWGRISGSSSSTVEVKQYSVNVHYTHLSYSPQISAIVVWNLRLHYTELYVLWLFYNNIEDTYKLYMHSVADSMTALILILQVEDKGSERYEMAS